MGGGTRKRYTKNNIPTDSPHSFPTDSHPIALKKKTTVCVGYFISKNKNSGVWVCVGEGGVRWEGEGGGRSKRL